MVVLDPIKITFISTLAYNYFFPNKIQQAGGHTRMYNLARKFAQRSDYEVTCLTGDFGQKSPLIKDGVRMIKAPLDRATSVWQVLHVLLNNDADIYVDFCASPRLFLLMLVQKLKRTKYIFLTGHDNDVDGNYRKIENALFYYTYLMGLKHADTVVAQIPKHSKLLKQKYNIHSDLVLSPYFDIEKTDLVEKKIVLWVGRAASYKRPDLFVALAKRFPDLSFVMICNRSDYDNGFMNTLNQSGTDHKNLKFYEYVAYPDMKRYYKEAMVLVNTSESEGFPNTFIEAAMHHTPIVSYRVDPNQMLSKHKCGYACHGDFNLLVDKLKDAVYFKTRREQMGINAFYYANKYHQLDQAVNRFDKIIKSILTQPQPKTIRET